MEFQTVDHVIYVDKNTFMITPKNTESKKKLELELYIDNNIDDLEITSPIIDREFKAEFCIVDSDNFYKNVDVSIKKLKDKKSIKITVLLKGVRIYHLIDSVV